MADVVIVAPDQLKLQDALINPQHWVNFVCLSNHPITGDPLPYARGLVEISNGIFCRKDVAAYGGVFMTASNPSVDYGTGGGCVQIGHGFQRSETWNPPADPPRINLTDPGFNTLYITAGSSLPPNTIDSVLANMKLRDLTANGAVNFNDINARLYRDVNSIRVQTPSAGGLIVEQNLWSNALAVGTTIGANGRITGSDGVVGNGVAIGCAPFGSLSWPYESIQLASYHNLRINFGSTEKYMFGNNGTLQINNGNILPSSANQGNIGTNTQYWGSMWTNYLRYKNISTFDAYDDLTLAKNYKTMTITEEGIEKEVIDPESLPFLKAESKEPFFDNGKTTGFLLGCIKALVHRIETLENQLKDQAAA